MGLTASVLGASGYAGGELLGLLASHPALSVVAAGARSHAGSDLGVVHPQLRGVDLGGFVGVDIAARTEADVCFSCMPSGVLSSIHRDVAAGLVIDLSDDHRASPGWTYALTEHAREEVARSTRVANPGCYPTASLLGLIPFTRAGLITGPVMIDALSGISGAGKGLGDAMSFAALYGSAAAYGATTHRHVPEIERGLETLGASSVTVSFTPHLVPMARGLLVTARAALATPASDAEMLQVLIDTYDAEPFVDVTDQWPTTKTVHGTNQASVSARVDERANLLIVSVAIDNLGKGAAGQALQNANVALGLEEDSGLQRTAVWP